MNAKFSVSVKRDNYDSYPADINVELEGDDVALFLSGGRELVIDKTEFKRLVRMIEAYDEIYGGDSE